MVKRFKKWRDDLTISQAYKIMRLVTIIIAIIILSGMILNWERTKIEEKILCFIMIICMLAFVYFISYLVLNVWEKERTLEIEEEWKKIIPKLKEDEFTEIYLKREPRCRVSELILDGYDAHEKRYFAKKEEDRVYVIMKEEETIIKEYHISNYLFFDYHFTFTKEEQ